MTNTEPKKMSLENRLKMAREIAGLSQGQVAKMLDLHRPSISEAEAGRRKVSAEELSKLAQIYNVSVAWLIGDESETEDEARIQLAAREFSKLKPEDVERLFNLLKILHKS